MLSKSKSNNVKFKGLMGTIFVQKVSVSIATVRVGRKNNTIIHQLN